jgi:hypothetical protein
MRPGDFANLFTPGLRPVRPLGQDGSVKIELARHPRDHLLRQTLTGGQRASGVAHGAEEQGLAELVVRRAQAAQPIEILRTQGVVPNEIALIGGQRHHCIPRLVAQQSPPRHTSSFPACVHPDGRCPANHRQPASAPCVRSRWHGDGKSDKLIDGQEDGQARIDPRMALVGYARVSTQDQNPDLQRDALASAGCVRVFEDAASGARAERPGLAEALDYVRDGDVLVVWKLDRLGRSLSHLIETVAGLEAKGVGFRSLTEAIDTTTPGGRLVFHLFGALGEFERDLIRERWSARTASCARPTRSCARHRRILPRRSSTAGLEAMIAFIDDHRDTTGSSRSAGSCRSPRRRTTPMWRGAPIPKGSASGGATRRCARDPPRLGRELPGLRRAQGLAAAAVAKASTSPAARWRG